MPEPSELFRRVERYKKVNKSILEKLIGTLPKEYDWEKDVLSLHYGLFGNQIHSIKKIAYKFDRSKAVIVRFENRGLKYLGLYRKYEMI